MSLINQVLKELNQKKKNRGGRPSEIPLGLQDSERRLLGHVNITKVIVYSVIFLSVVTFAAISLTVYKREVNGISKVNNLSSIAKTVTDSSVMGVDRRMVLAKKSIAENQYIKAVALLNVPVVVNSSDVVAIKTLVVLLVKTHQYNAAKDVVDSALLAKPGDADLIYAKAYYMYSQRDFDGALDVLQQYNPNLEHHTDYYGLLAQVFLKKSQPSMALSLYRMLIDQSPNDSTWWLGLALALQAENQMDNAQVAFKRAISLGNLPVTTVAYIQKQLQVQPYNPPV